MLGKIKVILYALFFLTTTNYVFSKVCLKNDTYGVQMFALIEDGRNPELNKCSAVVREGGIFVSDYNVKMITVLQDGLFNFSTKHFGEDLVDGDMVHVGGTLRFCKRI